MLKLLFVLAAGASALCNTGHAEAAIVELSYQYSGTGSQNFPSNTVLMIEGTCTSACDIIPIMMHISGTGPGFGMASGWGAGASVTVSDNLADTTSFSVSTGNFPGLKHETFGSFLSPSTIPSTLFVSTSGFITSTGGPATIDYSIRIALPDGLRATAAVPETSTWAMIILGFGGLAWMSRRRSRYIQNLAKTTQPAATC